MEVSTKSCNLKFPFTAVQCDMYEYKTDTVKNRQLYYLYEENLQRSSIFT